MRPSPASWLCPLLAALTCALWTLLRLPAPLYLPESHVITMVKPAQGIAMKWFGLVGVTFALGIVLGLVLTPLARRLPERIQRLGPLAAALAIVLCIAVQAWLAAAEWLFRG